MRLPKRLQPAILFQRASSSPSAAEEAQDSVDPTPSSASLEPPQQPWTASSSYSPTLSASTASSPPSRILTPASSFAPSQPIDIITSNNHTPSNHTPFRFSFDDPQSASSDFHPLGLSDFASPPSLCSSPQSLHSPVLSSSEFSSVDSPALASTSAPAGPRGQFFSCHSTSNGNRHKTFAAALGADSSSLNSILDRAGASGGNFDEVFQNLSSMSGLPLFLGLSGKHQQQQQKQHHESQQQQQPPCIGSPALSHQRDPSLSSLGSFDPTSPQSVHSAGNRFFAVVGAGNESLHDTTISPSQENSAWSSFSKMGDHPSLPPYPPRSDIPCQPLAQPLDEQQRQISSPQPTAYHPLSPIAEHEVQRNLPQAVATNGFHAVAPSSSEGKTASNSNMDHNAFFGNPSLLGELSHFFQNHEQLMSNNHILNPSPQFGLPPQPLSQQTQTPAHMHMNSYAADHGVDMALGAPLGGESIQMEFGSHAPMTTFSDSLSRGMVEVPLVAPGGSGAVHLSPPMEGQEHMPTPTSSSSSGSESPQYEFEAFLRPFQQQQQNHQAQMLAHAQAQAPLAQTPAQDQTQQEQEDEAAKYSVPGYSPTGAYTCTYFDCPYRFVSQNYMQRHKRDHHRGTGNTRGGRKGSSSRPENDSDNQNGPHICTSINPQTSNPCNAVFSRPYDLTRHEDTIHNRSKAKAICELCTGTKTFSRRDALTRHYRVCHPDVIVQSRRAAKKRKRAEATLK